VRIARSTDRFAAGLRSRGFVLPVVLVMLVVMTTVVLFMMRRGTVDERLAANVRDIVTLETAAAYALRSCELWVWRSPPGRAPDAGMPDPPRLTGAPVSTDPAAWRDAVRWANDAITLDAAARGPGLTRAQCLIEDATAELEGNTQFVSGPLRFDDPGFRKYRITVEAESQPDPLVAPRIARAQSELRMWVN
jgi:Tfp pilus assembly protein PilX